MYALIRKYPLLTFATRVWALGLLATVLLVFMPRGAAGQIYSENFESQSVGDQTDDDGIWSLDVSGANIGSASDDYFEVREQDGDLVLEGQDLDGPAIWTTAPNSIDISNASNPGFSLAISETGDLENSDYVDVEYSTDGGSNFTLIEDYNGLGSSSHTLEGNFGSVTVTKRGVSGTSLVLRVTMENNAGSEELRLDDVAVTDQTTPTVQFSSSGTSVMENDGSATLTVELQGADGTEVNADVAFQSGQSSASTSDIANYSTETVTFSSSATNGDTKEVTVDITNDSEQEGREAAEFALTNVSGGKATGGPFTLDIVDTEVVINEVLADPPSGSDGDANDDGTRSATEDEFIEIFNNSSSELDLSGFSVSDGTEVRHTFPQGTVLDRGEAVTVFGGGTPAAAIPGVVQTASNGSLSLTNGGDNVTVRDASGNPYLTFSYGSEGGDAQSLTRDPDFTGDFVKHANASGAGGALFSPGEQVDGTPLPVELAAFRAVAVEGDGARLTWTTASETNNAGFTVQRKREDGPDGWTKVGYVESKAPSGTTTEPQSYSYVTNDLPIGAHRFRLRQEDLDGSTTLTDAVTVDIEMKEALTLDAPVPNPVSGGATVSFTVKERVEATLQLYNTLGQRVKTVYQGTPPAEQAHTVRLESSGLASGVYFLRLDAGGQTRTTRVTIVR